MTKPMIETGRLILRPFEREDIEAVYRFSREPSLGRWMPDQVYADLDEARETVEFLAARCAQRALPYVLAVALVGGELIGHVGLSRIPEGVEIGYAIGEKYQGAGYATEAVRAFSEWSVAQFSLEWLYGAVDAQNAASARVLEKAGFAKLPGSAGGARGRVYYRK